MTASPPIVSLVIATYRRGPLIARTLDSVLTQTRPPSEVLVVDDGSGDGSADWIRSHYPQVRVLEKDNGGTSSARNFGANAATGSVLVFLDHDDELLPHAVETLLALLDAFPEARAAFADHTYVNEPAGVRYPNHHSAQPAFARMRRIAALRTKPEGRLHGRPMYHALLQGNLLQQPWAVHRDAFLELGGFAADVRYCEDWDLYLRLTRRFPVAVSDQVISHHHVEGTNLHLLPGQEEMHLRVMRRQLAGQRWRDLGPTLVLRRRLGMFHKAAGDALRPRNLREAWRAYARALAFWPFDHVVVLWVVWWTILLVMGAGAAPAENEARG